MNTTCFKALNEAEKQILSEHGNMAIQAVKRECLNLAWLHKAPTSEMVWVDNIKEHQPGDSVPFFEWKELIGSIIIPDELYVITRFVNSLVVATLVTTQKFSLGYFNMTGGNWAIYAPCTWAIFMLHWIGQGDYVW